MIGSLKQILDSSKSIVGLPFAADLRVISTRDGFPINRKKVVSTFNLRKYLATVDDSTRVASFLKELERRVGASVGAKIELWLAGQRIDGRRSIGSLR